MLTAGCPDGSSQTEETGTWPHEVSSPWVRNGNQEWDATGIPPRKFPSLRVVPPLLGLGVRSRPPAALHSPDTEQIGCLSWPPSLLLGLSLHESEKCKRSITVDPWRRPQRLSGVSTRELSLCLPYTMAKILRYGEKTLFSLKKLANLGSRLPPSEKSGVIPLPSAAIPSFSTYSPWLNMDSAAVLGRIMITRDNLHVSRSIADRMQKEMPSLSHCSKSIS